jgi:hypothetical protein
MMPLDGVPTPDDDDGEDWNGVRRVRRIFAAAVVLIGLLAAASFYNAVFYGPAERDEIRQTAQDAEDVADGLAVAVADLQRESEARLESDTGVNALVCTADNRHDAQIGRILDVLADAGFAVEQIAATIPPATNCGELLCQIIAAVEEDAGEAEIEIQDPFGPDRDRKPCGDDASAPTG